MRNLLVVAFLAVQLLLPLRGVLWSDHDTQADFSWNMYTRLYECRADYRLVDGQQRTQKMDIPRFFRAPDRYMTVYRRDTLPRFHAWLCEEHRKRGEPGNIVATVRCSANQGPYVALVRPVHDICSAPDYGVEPEEPRP